MKLLLRSTALTVAFALSVLAAGRAVITPPPPNAGGTCRTQCIGDSTPTVTFVNWQTTLATCCANTSWPCPTGTHPGYSTFHPTGGFSGFCPVAP
jgi:hypothetical protein